MLGPPSFPAANSQQRISNNTPSKSSLSTKKDDKKEGRTKVALKPGRSLMDWIRLANSGKDIQGFHGRSVGISKEELSKHNRVDDCWMAIRGNLILLFDLYIF